MKKAFIIFLSFILTFTFLPLSISAAGDDKEDWEIYENYLYYNNDGTKTSGYTIDKIKFQTKDEYFGIELDASYFPEIADRIERVESLVDGVYEHDIILKTPGCDTGKKIPQAYSEEDIDRYIECVRYVKGLDFVLDTILWKTTIEPFDTHPLHEWRNYEDYEYYKGNGSSNENYLIDGVFVMVDYDLLGEKRPLTPSDFPELKDRIERIDNYETLRSGSHFISFNGDNKYKGLDTEYTEEQIDEFVDMAEYIYNFRFVTKIRRNFVYHVDLDGKPLHVSSGDRDVYVDGVDESGKALTKWEKNYIAESYLKDAGLIEQEILDMYETGEGISWPPPKTDPDEWPDECKYGGHLCRWVRITAVRHCLFDTEPRCLECSYRVSYCTREGCGFYEEQFDEGGSIKRISCHAGTSLKDWEIYDNYPDYEGGDSRKTSGYTTDSATVYFTNSFASEHDALAPSDFPGLVSLISSVDYSKATRSAVIHLKTGAGEKLSAENIDMYINILNSLAALRFVESVVPAYKTAEQDPPVRPDEKNEEERAEPNDAQTNGAPGAAPAEGAPAQDPQKGATQKPALHNPQTGDELYLLVFVAALSFAVVLSASVIFKRRRRADHGE